MLIEYRCCDCGRSVAETGLDDPPDPPRCMACHLTAVIAFAGAEAWIREVAKGTRALSPFVPPGQLRPFALA